MTRKSLVLPLLLAACVSTNDQYDCSCVEIPTDEEAIAMQGFTDAALYSQGMEKLDNGDDLSWYEYNPDVATPEMIAASPGNTCGHWGQTVVSHYLTDSYGDTSMRTPGSKYLVVVCATPPEQASQ